MSFRLGYRPALDGVRGLAILTVMVVHTGLPFAGGGFISVDVFFVLSGFLITSVLLEEWGRTGTIRLRRFYARRALRLLPALIVLLSVLYAFSLTIAFPAAASDLRREILFTFFYVTNWAVAFHHMPAMGMLGHGWTLAIEEQFYMAWPLVLLLMLRAGLTHRTMGIATIGMMLVAALHRLVMWSNGAEIDRMFFGFDTRCDTILAGCLAALYATSPNRRTDESAARLLRAAAYGGVGLLVLLSATASHDGWYMYCGMFTVVAMAAGFVLIELVDYPGSLLARLMSSRVLVHAGEISYGLYLWHWPVFLTLAVYSAPYEVSPTVLNVARFVVTVVLAEISSIWIERPFLRLKGRWSGTVPGVGTGNSAILATQDAAPSQASSMGQTAAPPQGAASPQTTGSGGG